jgi:hypothetical protein
VELKEEVDMAMKRWIALLNAICMLAFISPCRGEGGEAPSPVSTTRTSSRWFPYLHGWLGADAAYSIPLGNGKSLWFFDDTFVGVPEAISRKQAPAFIHNSVGISSCSGQNCTIEYYWAVINSAKPGPIFVAPGSDWFWPMDGFIYNGTLYVALMQMHASGSGAFGFAYSGSQLASVRNYMAPPSQWSITYQQLNTGRSAVPGVSIVVDQGPDGNPDPTNPSGASYAYFFTGVGSPRYLALLRIPLAELNRLARPGNADWQYLNKSGTWKAWQQRATTLPGDNAAVIHPGASEMTVRYHSSTDQWIAVYPVGLDGQAHYSLSSSLTSGWGASELLYTYPEMQASNSNYTPNVFCYAVKEHVELETPGQLFFTYVCNSKVEKEIIENTNLYHPIVVTQRLPTK